MINYRVPLILAVMGLISSVLAETSPFTDGSTVAEALDNQDLTFTSEDSWISQSQDTNDGQDAAFTSADFTHSSRLSTTVDGPAIVRFWWKVEGSKSMSVIPSTLSEKQDDTWSQSEALVHGHGPETVEWTLNAGGNSNGYLDEVEVIPPVSLSDALDSNLTFATGGSGSWHGYDSLFLSSDGQDFAMADGDPNTDPSWLETTVVGPGLIGFAWTEGRFLIDGTELIEKSSSTNVWATVHHEVPAGEHKIRWYGVLDAIQWQATTQAAFGQALDTETYSWAITGTSQWSNSTTDTHDGEDALIVTSTLPSSLETSVSGPGELSFWMRAVDQANNDGTVTILIDGHLTTAQTPTATWGLTNLEIPPGTHTISWESADITWALDEVRFQSAPPITFGDALDTTGLVWESGSRHAWTPYQSTQAFDGEDQVAISAPDERAWLRTYVDGPGLLQFWWKSEQPLDHRPHQDSMVFRVDGAPLLQWDGEASGEWTDTEVYLTPGRHELRWNQHGRNTGYLDQVSFTPGTSNPLAEAMDLSPIIVATSGNSLWQSTTGEEFEGGDALHMPLSSLPIGGESAVALSVQGPAKIQWRWRTTGLGQYQFEQTNDSGLPLLLDGSTWEHLSKTVPSGTTIGRWSPLESIYGKEAWIDQVVITPTGNASLADALDLPADSSRFGLPAASGWIREATSGVDGDAAHTSVAASSSGLTLGVVGPAAVSFYWKRDGAGDMTVTGMPFVGQASDSWTKAAFLVGDGNHEYNWNLDHQSVQAVPIYLDQVEVAPFIPLSEALDSDLTFTTGGDYEWHGIPGGNDYASAAAMDDGLVSTFPQTSTWLETRVEGPGLLEFNWARTEDVLVQADLFLTIDGKQVVSANSTAWESVTTSLAEGDHTLRWIFRSSGGHKANSAALDRVRVIPNSAHPTTAATEIPDTFLISSSGWDTQDLVTTDGNDALQSLKPKGYRAWLQIEVEGPAVVGSWVRGVQVSASGLPPQPSVADDVNWSWQDLRLPEGRHMVRWQHSTSTNGWIDGVRIQYPQDLSATLNSDLSFTSNGDLSAWTAYALGDTGEERVALSPVLHNAESSWIEATISGPGELAFDWKTSADNVQQAKIWLTMNDGLPLGYPKQTIERYHLPIPSGQHRVRWTIQASRAGSQIGRTVGDAQLSKVTFTTSETPGTAAEIPNSYVESGSLLEIDRANFFSSPSAIAGDQFNLPLYGPSTVRFQWRGDEAPEWRQRDLIVPPGFHEVLIRGDRAFENVWIDQVQILADIPLNIALDTDLLLETDAETPWRGHLDINAIDGADMATAYDEANAELRSSVTGPGVLSFWRNGGSFQSTGEITKQAITESDGWRHHVLTIGEGDHQLTWTSGSLDQVRWEAGLAPFANALNVPAETPLLTSGHKRWSTQTEFSHSDGESLGCSLDAGTAQLIGRFEGSASLSFWSRKRGGQLSVTVTSLAGTLDQNVYVRDSEIPRDRPIGGRTQQLGTSDNTWEQYAVALPRGTSLVTWYFQGEPDSAVWIDEITLAPSPSLEEAADSDLGLTTGAEYPWAGIPARSTPDGEDVVGSGEIPTTATSWLRATVPSKGTLRFRWRVVGAPGTSEDYVAFNASGAGKLLERQAGDWSEVAIPFEDGPKVIWWSFHRKSITGNSMAFVDQIRFSPSFDINNALDQPDSQSFSSTGSSSPRLQTTATHDGVDALALAGTQSNLQTEFLSTGLLSFVYKNDSTQDMRLKVGEDIDYVLPASSNTSDDNGWVEAHHLLSETSQVEWQGSELSYLDEIQLLPLQTTNLTLSQSLDNETLTWNATANENAPWQANDYGNGLDFARVPLASNAEASLETTITGPGTFGVQWCREGNASVQLDINDITHNLSGAPYEWHPTQIELPAGEHIIRLSFTGSTEKATAAWVDHVTLVSNRLLTDGLDLPTNQVILSTGDHLWIRDSQTTDNDSDAVRSQGGNSTLATYIQGPGTLRYHYRIDESDIDGLQMTINGNPVARQALADPSPNWAQATAHLTEGLHLVRWTYQRQSLDRNSGVWLDRVTITPNPSLAEVADDNNLIFTSTNQTPWVGERSAAARDGIDRMIVGLTNAQEQSTLRTTITGPGVCTFFWRKPGGDSFIVTLNGKTLGTATEALNTWEQGLVSIPAGEHQLAWIYRNSSAFLDGENVAALDQIAFTPGDPLPFSSALDNDGAFHSFGNAVWKTQSVTTHDGEDAAQSGTGLSILKREITLTERSSLSFWWNQRYGNVPNLSYGTATFTSNGISRAWNNANRNETTAESGWQQVILPLASGTTTLEWQYDPESPMSTGTLFLDQITITPYQITSIDEATDTSLSFIHDAEFPWQGVISPLASDGQDHLIAGDPTPGKSSTLEARVTGPGSLTFDWLKTGGLGTYSVLLDGKPMANASSEWSNILLSIPPGDHTVTWNYLRSFSASQPYTTALLDKLAFTSSPHPLVDALDLENSSALKLNGWVRDTNASHDGIDAARSGATGLETETSLSISVHGPSTISFWSKVTGDNILRASIDGSRVWTHSDAVDWIATDITVGDGAHTLTWSYFRQTPSEVEPHYAWIDEIRVSPVITVVDAIESTLNLEATRPWDSRPSLSAGDGQDALFSPTTSSTLEATVQGPGLLSFWWQNSGSLPLNFDVDAFRIRSLATGSTWEKVEQKIPAGEHTLRWQSRSRGAGIDRVAYQPEDILTNYTAWAERRQLIGDASLKQANPDNDATNNFIEYAFNLDPSRSKRGLDTLSGVEGHLPNANFETRDAGKCLIIEFIRRKDAEIRYRPKFSNDMTNWSYLTGRTTVTDLSDGWERVTVCDTVLIQQNGQRFAAVDVEEVAP